MKKNKTKKPTKLVLHIVHCRECGFTGGIEVDEDLTIHTNGCPNCGQVETYSGGEFRDALEYLKV